MQDGEGFKISQYHAVVPRNNYEICSPSFCYVVQHGVAGRSADAPAGFQQRSADSKVITCFRVHLLQKPCNSILSQSLEDSWSQACRVFRLYSLLI